MTAARNCTRQLLTRIQKGPDRTIRACQSQTRYQRLYEFERVVLEELLVP